MLSVLLFLLILSHSLCPSLFLFLSLCPCVSVSLTLTLSPHHPGDPTSSSLPADNSWVHTCPQKGGLARPFSWVHVVLQECPPLPLQWAWLGGGSFPGCTGEGAAATPAAGTIAVVGNGSIASLHTGTRGAKWSGLGLTLGTVEQGGAGRAMAVPPPRQGNEKRGAPVGVRGVLCSFLPFS